MMKSFKLLIVAVIIMAIVTGCNSEATEDKTIRLGITPWSSTVPPSKIAKLILEDMGYSVEEISADAGGVYAGLSKGDIDVFMDAWLPDLHKNYMESFGDKINDTSVSYPDGALGWVIPTYVEGIRSIDDIKGKEDLFDGKMYGIEEGAGMTQTSKEIIEAYGLELEYVASSEGGMLAQASKLIKDEQPVIFLGWRPHPMFVNYDLKVLEDTQQFFKTSEVHVLTNIDLEEKASEVYDFFRNWSIDVSDIEVMITEIEAGTSPEEVAQNWIDNNQDKVDEMLGK